MEMLTQNRLTHNAYRILGLGADASQQAIDQAARRMRLWASAQRVPGTSWDLPWLGNLQRSKSDIEQAVAKLADPSSRLRERLMWFCGAPENFAAADVHAIAEALGDANGSGDAQHGHNAAVAQLAAAIMQPLPIQPQSWQSVLSHFQKLSDSQEQLRWQLQLEQDGGFEKRASEEEIADSQRAMPREIAVSLGRHIESALEDDDVEAANSLLAILRSAGGKTDQGILDRLEEVFERRCRNIADDLRAGIRGDHSPQRNARTAEEATRDFERDVASLRRDLEKLAEDQPERIRRIRWHYAKMLSMIATAWVWSHEFVKAEEVLNQAMSLAQGLAQEEEIRGQLVENQPRAEEQRRRYTMVANASTGYAMSYTSPGAVAPAGDGMIEYFPGRTGKQPGKPIKHVPVPPKGFTIGRPIMPANRVQPPKSNAGWRWGTVLLIIVLVRLAAFMGTDHSSSSNSSSYNQPLYNLPNSSRSYRPRQQIPLVPPRPTYTTPQDEAAERNYLRSVVPPPPTVDRDRLSPIYRDVPTTPRAYQPPPRETGRYFNWSPIVVDPAPSGGSSGNSSGINADNAGLSNSSTGKSGNQK